MQNIQQELEYYVLEELQPYLNQATISQPLIFQTKDPRHGDYQCNAALALAKQQRCNPRELGQKWQESLQKKLHGICSKIEVAGPGFLNFFLRQEYVLQALKHPPEERQPSNPKRLVIDYSSPNVAKSMHVGHLRGSIIGDAISRISEKLGYDVIRQNHIGDWGTQFGMLCQWVIENNISLPSLTTVTQLEDLYKAANQAFSSQPDGFAQRARDRVQLLHNQDTESLTIWKHLVNISRQSFQEIYKTLGVLLSPQDEKGESSYHQQLPPLVEELKEQFSPQQSSPRCTCREDQGATCLYFWKPDGTPEYQGKDKEPLPMIIQKSNGAFLYATTDIAALRYRIEELQADRIVVVTDSRQKLHFSMLHTLAESGHWLQHDKKEVSFEHVSHGSVLGEDKKPLKTRSGEPVKLQTLLHEATQKALERIQQNTDLEDIQEEHYRIAQAVGIGAIKYADLSQNPQSDYVFSFDKMLAFEGNTGPYLQYAYARICALLRKSKEQNIDVAQCAIHSLEHSKERQLALHILRFQETLHLIQSDWRIHLLADYLYQLAGFFMSFYENCPILKEGVSQQDRESRLALALQAQSTLKSGLYLLGIEVVERM